MSDTVTKLRTRGVGEERARTRPPFNARPVCAAGRESRSSEGPYATHYTATASSLYINRLSGSDRFGKVSDAYIDRGDLVATGRCHPQQKMPPELKSGDRLWREADEAAALEGAQAISATHIVGDLPVDADPARWSWLAETYAYRHLVDKGMIVDWAIHCRRVDGVWTGIPHVHMLATSRFWRPNGRVGARQWQWLANADQIRTAEDAWLRLVGLRPSLTS